MRRTALIGTTLLVALAGCRPEYPACQNDTDCRGREVCVGRRCQQCRDSSDCRPGEECRAGRCGHPEGWCSQDADCPADRPACIDHRCRPCGADADCGEGGRCRSGRCLRRGQCDGDDDCQAWEDCVAGKCVSASGTAAAGAAPAPAECTLGPVFFDFNIAAVGAAAVPVLQANAECLGRTGRGVVLEGHTDQRGTEEYNMALSERRALAVRSYLEGLGVAPARMRTVPKGKTEAAGSDDAGWARDRRVDIRWQ